LQQQEGSSHRLQQSSTLREERDKEREKREGEREREIPIPWGCNNP